MLLFKIFSILALIIAVGCVIYTIRFIRATQSNMRDVTDAAGKCKGFNARLTRVHNNHIAVTEKQQAQIAGIRQRLGKMVEFPVKKPDSTVD